MSYDWAEDYYIKNNIRINDPVWVEERKPQPNGKVVDINKHDRLVMVQFHDDEGSTELYDMDLFYDAWVPLCGGYWGISPYI
jgi:hypothetical protein